jgi:hypothetical protein
LKAVVLKQWPFLMMKRIIKLLLVAILISNAGYAQKDLMSLSEQNKYTYFKVGTLPATSVNTEALAAYLKKNVSGLQSASYNGATVTGKGGMLVYKQGLISGQEEGRIDYQLAVDFKEDKYRLVITDFTFTPYQRNRYGVFAPVDNVSFALETDAKKFSAKQLNGYLDKLGAYGKKVEKALADFVFSKAAVAPKPADLKKVDTQSW